MKRPEDGEGEETKEEGWTAIAVQGGNDSFQPSPPSDTGAVVLSLPSNHGSTRSSKSRGESKEGGRSHEGEERKKRCSLLPLRRSRCLRALPPPTGSRLEIVSEATVSLLGYVLLCCFAVSVATPLLLSFPPALSFLYGSSLTPLHHLHLILSLSCLFTQVTSYVLALSFDVAGTSPMTLFLPRSSPPESSAGEIAVVSRSDRRAKLLSCLDCIVTCQDSILNALTLLAVVVGMTLGFIVFFALKMEKVWSRIAY